jgi:L-asparaginase II
VTGVEQDVVAIEVVRGGVVECVHRARAAVTFPDGTSWTLGDATIPTYPRSSLKPIQAIAMCRAGLDVTGSELAISAASHLGEPYHLVAVRSILAGAGLTEADLQNTPDLPIEADARIAWIREGRGPERVAQNCSGKHAAMVRTCVRAGWDTATYLEADHPLQRLIRETLAEYTAEPIPDPSVDGCGAPAFTTTLVGLARAFGTFAAATDGPARHIADAYRAYPEYVSGTGHADLAIHRAVPGSSARAAPRASSPRACPTVRGSRSRSSTAPSGDAASSWSTILTALGVDSPGARRPRDVSRTRAREACRRGTGRGRAHPGTRLTRLERSAAITASRAHGSQLASSPCCTSVASRSTRSSGESVRTQAK